MSVKSDGGSTPDLYGIPEGITDFTQLCQRKGMLAYQYNCAKAAWRWGGKDGTSLRYDLKKIIYFATEALAELDELELHNKGVEEIEIGLPKQNEWKVGVWYCSDGSQYTVHKALERVRDYDDSTYEVLAEALGVE